MKAKLKHVSVDDSETEDGWSIDFTFNVDTSKPWLSKPIGGSLVLPIDISISELGEALVALGEGYIQQGID